MISALFSSALNNPIDYTGNDFDLYAPEVGEKKPNSHSQPVQVSCPSCEFPNIFWGVCDGDGDLIEHYGRRCQGLIKDAHGEHQCDFRFVFKECPHCGGAQVDLSFIIREAGHHRIGHILQNSLIERMVHGQACAKRIQLFQAH